MSIPSIPGVNANTAPAPAPRAAAPPAPTEPPEPKDLVGAPTPEIDRPFVLVPGWTTSTKTLQGIGNLLTHDKANGGEIYYVKQGQILEQDAKGDLEPIKGSAKDGRVFEMVLSDTRQSPDKNLPELQENFDAISKATGFSKVDAEGYSQGGLDARLYLDNGGDHVNKFMMLGTPNHGTAFGEKVIGALDHHLGLFEKIGHLSEADRGSMEWLREEQHSPELQKLNADWSAEAARTNGVLSVGNDGLATLAPGDLPIELQKGDGTVPVSSLGGLPGLQTALIHNHIQHGVLNDSADVEKIRANFFGWQTPPGSNPS